MVTHWCVGVATIALDDQREQISLHGMCIASCQRLPGCAFDRIYWIDAHGVALSLFAWDSADLQSCKSEREREHGEVAPERAAASACKLKLYVSRER